MHRRNNFFLMKQVLWQFMEQLIPLLHLLNRGLGVAGNAYIGGNANVTGSITMATEQTDHKIYFSADQFSVLYVSGATLNWTYHYSGVGIYSLNTTATGVNSSIIFCNLTSWLRTASSKGWKLNSVTMAYNISGANLTTLNKVIYKNLHRQLCKLSNYNFHDDTWSLLTNGLRDSHTKSSFDINLLWHFFPTQWNYFQQHYNGLGARLKVPTVGEWDVWSIPDSYIYIC